MKFAIKNQKTNNASYQKNPYIKIIDQKLCDELNNYCVECGSENPEYISINNGVFICVECAQNHLKFPKNISRIIKNDKNSLNLNEIQCLLCGGNRALLEFINNEFPKLSEFPPNILYRTQAMVYYRQNLQYLINGGIPPIKPSVKYGYKISNFLNKVNYNNFMTSENEFYNTIVEERGFINKMNYMQNFGTNVNFYNTGNNFGRRINFDNSLDNRFSNTINNKENYFDNYIINKPKQINFQNNNNIIIGNIDNNNDNNIIYSPQTIKVNFNKKNFRKNSRNPLISSDSSENVSHFNNIYIKPKLILSPKVHQNYTLSKKITRQRNGSADIIKKDYYFPLEKELSNKDKVIISLNNSNKNIDNIFNNDSQNDIDYFKNKKMNKNLSQETNIKLKNPNIYINQNKYIHKSLSQKKISNDNSIIDNKFTIQNDSNKINKQINNFNDIIPQKKTIIVNSNINKTLISNTINNNEKLIPIIKRRTINNSKLNFNKNHKISNLIKNNEKFSNYETMNFSEIDSFAIKINLKKNKKDNIDENKKNLIKEKNYFSCDESKIELKKNNKNKKEEKEEKENIDKDKDKQENKNKIEINQNKNNINKEENKNKIDIKQKDKDNKKEEDINEDKKNISKIKINKNLSQEDILKDIKDVKKKFNEKKGSNKEDNKVSIRNKYKQKTLNK